MDFYGVIRSLSAEWCADTTKPVLGPMSIRGTMVKAFPSKRDVEDFLHLPDHELYQILATVPAGLFTHVGPSLNRMSGAVKV